MTTPLNVAALVDAIEAGEKFTYRFFWSHRARKDGRLSDSCFSQWWPSKFEVDGQSYANAEQWMMSSKARLFGDHESETRIMATDDPNEIKTLGRRVRGFVQDRWDAACFDLVSVGSIAKFEQNGALTKYLLATGEDLLVEASPLDVVWGIGFARDAPEAQDPRAWRGQNLLGFALIRARGVIRGELEAVSIPGPGVEAPCVKDNGPT